jgi:hypothetical protein
VHLCFLSEPVGNLYQAPLISIWNCPAALAKRSRMIAGRYVASGCSPQWCSWRDGKRTAGPASAGVESGMAEMEQLASRTAMLLPTVPVEEASAGVAAVRRQMAERERSIRELQTIVEQLCETNLRSHQEGARQIARLEAKAGKAVADYEALAREWGRFRSWRIIRMALAVARIGQFVTRSFRAGSNKSA